MALLSSNSKLLLAEIFMTIGSSEKQLEQMRMALAKDRRFSTQSVFDEISGGQHSINLEQLQKFFSANDITADSLEIERVVHWYKSIRPDCWEHAE